MSTLSVKILDRPYAVRDEILHTYQAYCTHCCEYVRGPNGTAAWATKRPAVRAAKTHLEQHPRQESFLARITADGSVKVVDTITEGA